MGLGLGVRGLDGDALLGGLYPPSISPISRLYLDGDELLCGLYLPYISTISRPYLDGDELLGRLLRLLRRDAVRVVAQRLLRVRGEVRVRGLR